MPEAPSPDTMNSLVKFLICLAVIGTVIALIIYFTVVLPHAAALQAPSNFAGPRPNPAITPLFFIQ
jgi:hypothetical protein